MIGSFITRALVMALGYAYPAYECYKTVELNKPEIEQLRFWCQYWILVSALSIFERLGDAFVSWIPLYSEVKVAFFVYLWYSKTRGTTYVYDSFFKPHVAKYEPEIDRNLIEWRTRAGDMAVVYCQKAASYGQTRFFEILQFLASQSTPRPRPAQKPQPQGQGTKAHPQPSAPTCPAASKPEPETEEPPSPTSSTSSSQHQKEVAEVVGPSQPKPPPETVLNSPNKMVIAISRKTYPPSPKRNTASESPTVSRSTSEPVQKEAESMPTEPAAPTRSQSLNIPSKETPMDETIRLTRGRLKKTRSSANR